MLKADKKTGLSLGLLLVAILGTFIVSLILFAALVYGVRYAVVAGQNGAVGEREPLEMSNMPT